MGRKKTRIHQPTPFGEKLQALRVKRGLSKDEISKRAGVSTTYVSLLEDGVRQPSRETVLKLGQAFYPDGNLAAQDDLLVLAGFSPLHAQSPVLQQELTEIHALALAEDGDNFKAFSALLISLIKSGRLEQAQAQLQQGFQTFSEHVQLQSLLAMLELSKGRHAAAILTQEQAIGHFRTRPEPGVQMSDLLLNLGTMYFIKACDGAESPAQAIEDLEQARSLLKQAAELAPDDVYLLDEYARASFNLAFLLSGDQAIACWQETIAGFRAVLALENKQQLGLPMLKEATVFLALAYAKGGQLAEAELSLQLIGSFCPQYWLLHYVEACCLCLKFNREPSPQEAWLLKALQQLVQALEDPDPHNRTRLEAPQDPDFEVLHRLQPIAFASIFQSTKETNA